MTLRKLLLLTLSLMLLVTACSQGELRYTNPVYDHDAPDPTVVRAADGLYYAYTTQAADKRIPILKSKDLVHWQLVGDVFAELPTWATHDFWAPHILMRGGKYYLYYAARHKDTGAHTIGVAVADKPEGPFKDKGSPLVPYNNPATIDPFVLEDGDKLYLYWGSDRVPLLIQELSADGMSVVGDPAPVLSPSTGFEGYEDLVEGPWVIKREGYYYLFYSGDDCCDEPHYAVPGARSTSPEGPFEKYPGNPVLVAGERWNGPGHNAVIQDEAGDWWLLYHAFDRQKPEKGRVMLLDRITWGQDGWPVRMTPSQTEVPGPQAMRK